jgi:hypothetical protein
LTIGRVKSGKKLDSLLEYLRKENDKTWGAFEAGSICLFQSQLHPSGAVYTVLREEALRGERGGSDEQGKESGNGRQGKEEGREGEVHQEHD